MPQPGPKSTKDIQEKSTEQMTFYSALAKVNHGDCVTRESWDNPSLHLKMHKGQVCVKLDDGLYHPLIVSQEDFDGEDWTVVNGGPAKIPAKDITVVPIPVPQGKGDPFSSNQVQMDRRDLVGKDV